MKAAGPVSPATRVLTVPELRLDSGTVLRDVEVAYRTWGGLNSAADNAVLVCHALTGSADADSWWADLFGSGRALDPHRDFVICSNVLGSCYGTTGPLSTRPGAARPYGPEFPDVTVRDVVRLQHALVRALGVRRLALVLGGSLGGMQVLEWALLYPAMVDAIAPIATSGRHSAWCIGWSEAQRADPNWNDGWFDPQAPPLAGLAAARMIAMISYRSRASLEARFGRAVDGRGGFEVEGYLQHQGRKLIARFDANAYVVLTRTMDSHDVGAGRGAYETVLRGIRQPALVVGVDSDVLYPIEEQAELARLIPGSTYATLRSPHGHDAFLIEGAALGERIVDFRRAVAASRLSAGGAA
jgi:homoserine O-acetyltransferase